MSDANEPAFPHFIGNHIHVSGGLSKRELFAAMAMMGTMSNPLGLETLAGIAAKSGKAPSEELSEMCLGAADALLAALAKSPDSP